MHPSPVRDLNDENKAAISVDVSGFVETKPKTLKRKPSSVHFIGDETKDKEGDSGGNVEYEEADEIDETKGLRYVGVSRM